MQSKNDRKITLFPSTSHDLAFSDTHKVFLVISQSYAERIRAKGVSHAVYNEDFANAFHLADGNKEKPSKLKYVGRRSYSLWQETRNRIDLERAIAAFEDAMRLMSDGHPQQPKLYIILGMALLRRIEYYDKIDIEKAISVFQIGVLLTPDSHRTPCYYNNLGGLFVHRFKVSEDLADIKIAISYHQKAVHLTPDGHDDKPILLDGFGHSLHCCFKHTGDLRDIESAICALEQAVQLAPDGHVHKHKFLYSLSSCFYDRFERSSNLVDISKAISYGERAVHVVPDSNAAKRQYIVELGDSFFRRFEHTGNTLDIDRAIAYQERAVDITPDGDDKYGYRNNLGTSLLRRFEHSGELTDIHTAISIFEQAVHCISDSHGIAMASCLTNLGNSLWLRFSYNGAIIDIDKAISAHDRAVNLIPDDHSDKSTFLNNLACAISHRFERLGDLHDINRAIYVAGEAVTLTADSHEGKPGFLHNLGLAYTHRFNGFGDILDLDLAICASRYSVSLALDGHISKPRYLNGLGNTFLFRFQHSKDILDVESAIAAYAKAVDLAPDTHINKPTFLSNLGNSFSERFVCSGDLIDINEGISTLERAMGLSHGDHMSTPSFLINLSLHLRRRFLHSGDPTDASSAISHLRHAANSCTVSAAMRCQAAVAWAEFASTVGDSSMLDGYTVALDLLPRISWLGQTMPARLKQLMGASGLASQAAAAAISVGQCDMALEWLERGRSIVWNQLLHLRTPVDALHDVDPSLANDLNRVSASLDHASIHGACSEQSAMSLYQQLPGEDIAQKRRRLAEEWETLLNRARSISGFENFLQPKKISQLKATIQLPGPVAVINVHKSRCDALVVVADTDQVIHVPLNGISYSQLEDMHHSLKKILSRHGVRKQDLKRHMSRISSMMPNDYSFEEILSTLWVNVVKPVLDALAFSVISDGSDLPHIWWCPTGPLTFLPIHAAGLYDKHESGFKTSDFVVSSYTSTLEAILQPILVEKQLFQGILGVSLPSTPGQSSLPNAAQELSEIEQYGSRLKIHSLLGEQATMENVIEGMQNSSWLHLACHAFQDVSEPTESAFFLHDGKLTLSEIITRSFPHADFAFLSACQTAMGDENLSEHAIHLAAGMLAAGFKSVIATMWSINDDDAPFVAAEVYSHLLRGPEPNSDQAAYALHHAVNQLRERLERSGEPSPLSWAPFIHVGM